MNAQKIIYLLPLLALIGGSCVNQKILTENKISIRYVVVNQ